MFLLVNQIHVWILDSSFAIIYHYRLSVHVGPGQGPVWRLPNSPVIFTVENIFDQYF